MERLGISVMANVKDFVHEPTPVSTDAGTMTLAPVHICPGSPKKSQYRYKIKFWPPNEYRTQVNI